MYNPSTYEWVWLNCYKFVASSHQEEIMHGLMPVTKPKVNCYNLLMILPWHTKSILIIIYSFLKMPENAVFWHVLRTSNFKYQRPRFTTLFAKWGKSWQFTALIRSLSVVGQGVQNYSDFYGNGCILPAGGCII